MTELTPAKPFLEAVRLLLDKIEATQGSAVLEAAHLIAGRLVAGGMLHVFGTGHSHILAEEIFFRAGGLVQVNAILDPGLMLHISALGSTSLERLEGYAPIVLDRYDLRPEDVLLVVSNSGRNAVPIDAAIYARERGLKVIALTSAANYRCIPPRHSSGKHLEDFADVVIDTCVPEGDAAVTLPGLPLPIGPVSTIMGATLIQALMYETMQAMTALGHQPLVVASANASREQDHNVLFSGFRDRIRHW